MKNLAWSTSATAVMEIKMRGILLWLVGIPIPVIILLYFFGYM